MNPPRRIEPTLDSVRTPIDRLESDSSDQRVGGYQVGHTRISLKTLYFLLQLYTYVKGFRSVCQYEFQYHLSHGVSTGETYVSPVINPSSWLISWNPCYKLERLPGMLTWGTFRIEPTLRTSWFGRPWDVQFRLYLKSWVPDRSLRDGFTLVDKKTDRNKTRVRSRGVDWVPVSVIEHPGHELSRRRVVSVRKL